MSENHRRHSEEGFKANSNGKEINKQSILMFSPFRCSAVYKLDNTTCSSMQLTCGRWYLPNKDPVQCR